MNNSTHHTLYNNLTNEELINHGYNQTESPLAMVLADKLDYALSDNITINELEVDNINLQELNNELSDKAEDYDTALYELRKVYCSHISGDKTNTPYGGVLDLIDELTDALLKEQEKTSELETEKAELEDKNDSLEYTIQQIKGGYCD